jgi:Mrp family chromosome partitioning ATPase
MLSREQPLRTILVASAAPGEGKTIVASNLALAYREAGRNVAALDADLRTASLGGLLAARQGPGLADILAGRATFGQVVQEVPLAAVANGNGAPGARPRQAIPVGHAGIVPAGQHAGILPPVLASSQMRQALRTAADTYGIAIIDSPPLLAVGDVLPLLSEADGVILVSRVGVSTRESARRLLAELGRVPGINVLGMVVNGIPPRTYRARAYGHYHG